MGLLDRLLNRKKPAENRPHAPARAGRLPTEPRPATEPEKAPTKPLETPDNPVGEVSVQAAETEKAVAETNAGTATISTGIPEERVPTDSETVQPGDGTPTQDDATATPAPPAFDPVLQKQLDTYFARLRAVYPDGVITRLNTGHKKLAERGAALRKRTGQEGDLDAFFALGGFTYRRSAGGRPPLPLSEDLSSLEKKLKTYFPEGIPTVIAIRDTDHRLYLDLRALARRENRTVGEYLDAHGLR